MAAGIDMANVTQIGMDIWKWVVYGIIFVVAIGCIYAVAYWYNRKKRYKYIVRVFDKDAVGNVVQQPDDKGGIFLDKKTNYRLFLLRKNKFGLDPDEIPYLITSTGQKIVYLLQTGLKNFQFLKPSVSGNPGIVFNVQDEDVAWALNAYERTKMAFKQSLLQQLMPILGMAFVFTLVVVAMFFIFKNLGVLGEVAESMNAAAAQFTEAVKIQKLGSVVS